VEVHTDPFEHVDEGLRAFGEHGFGTNASTGDLVIRDDIEGVGASAVSNDVEKAPGLRGFFYLSYRNRRAAGSELIV